MRYLLAHICPHFVILAPCPIVFLSLFGTQLVLLQKKYLYTCMNTLRKPNLEEFLRKLFEQYRIENCGKQY